MKNLRFAMLILSLLAACACVLAQENVIAGASTDEMSAAPAAPVVEHFADRGNLPPMILVGIGYPGQSQDIPNYRAFRRRARKPSSRTTRDGGRLESFARRLESRGYDSLTLDTEVFADETHNSVFPVAITRGLPWLFPEE